MGIIQYPQTLAGQSGVIGALKFMVTTDNLATLTAAGYLNNPDLAVFPILASDTISCLYSFSTQTNTGTWGLFSVSISNGIITLSQSASAGGVILPTIANHIATYSNTSGLLTEDAATAINGGNIQAGLSGTAGYLASFPATAARGSFRFQATANAGNTVTTFTNAAMGQATTITVPDPAGATANDVIAPAALVNNNLVKASGTAGLVADAGIAATNVMLLNAVNTMASGSSIVAAKVNGTEASNAVTASGMSGVITTSSLTTGGGSSYAITWTNTFISSTSTILLTIMGGTNTTENITLKVTAGPGTSTLTIYNNTAATSLNGTIFIGYLII